MDKNKVTMEATIEQDQLAWLESMVGKYHLADESKALRVLLDFAMQDGDTEKIFKEIRCLRCG